jgi:hypothetical protein
VALGTAFASKAFATFSTCISNTMVSTIYFFFKDPINLLEEFFKGLNYVSETS